MNLSIFTDNDVVTVDGYQLVFDLSKFDLPEKLWAVFWDGESGHMEYTDDRLHEDISQLPDWVQPIIQEHQRLTELQESERKQAERQAVHVSNGSNRQSRIEDYQQQKQQDRQEKINQLVMEKLA